MEIRNNAIQILYYDQPSRFSDSHRLANFIEEMLEAYGYYSTRQHYLLYNPLCYCVIVILESEQIVNIAPFGQFAQSLEKTLTIAPVVVPVLLGGFAAQYNALPDTPFKTMLAQLASRPAPTQEFWLTEAGNNDFIDRFMPKLEQTYTPKVFDPEVYEPDFRDPETLDSLKAIYARIDKKTRETRPDFYPESTHNEYLEATKLFPNNVRLRYEYAISDIGYGNQENEAFIARELTTLIHMKVPFVGEVYVSMAHLYARHHAVDYARAAYQQAVAHAPDDKTIVYARAKYLITIGAIEEADAAYDELERIRTEKDVWPHYPQKEDFYKAILHHRKLIDLYTKHLEARPDQSTDYRQMRAELYDKLGDIAKAITDYTWLHINAPSAETAYCLKRLTDKRGDTQVMPIALILKHYFTDKDEVQKHLTEILGKYQYVVETLTIGNVENEIIFQKISEARLVFCLLDSITAVVALPDVLAWLEANNRSLYPVLTPNFVSEAEQDTPYQVTAAALIAMKRPLYRFWAADRMVRRFTNDFLS